MHPFALSRADDPAQAIAAHARDAGLAFIAGGTDLIGLIKDRAALPERLLDINGLPGMARIEPLPRGGLRIGALARMSDVAADAQVRRHFPVIAEALLAAASGQLRNMASMGGNIMQRTRCAYFRDEDELPCNKRRPGSGCAALHGLNRNHAIFGWSEACVATHPSDLAVALAALDAIVIVRGQAGERSIAFGDFHRLPGRAPELDTTLVRGELIVAIEVPASSEARASHYLKVRDRQSYEFALVSAAAAVALDGDRIRSARRAMGGVAHKPWRLAAAETALCGISLDDSNGLRSAIAASFADARPLARAEHESTGEAAVPGYLERVVHGVRHIISFPDGVVALVRPQGVDILELGFARGWVNVKVGGIEKRADWRLIDVRLPLQMYTATRHIANAEERFQEYLALHGEVPRPRFRILERLALRGHRQRETIG